MPMLLNGTVLHFVEWGWAGCAGGSESPGDLSVSIAPVDFTPSHMEIIQQPLCQHSLAAGLVAVARHGDSPELWYRLRQHFCLGPVSVLALCSKQRAEVYILGIF